VHVQKLVSVVKMTTVLEKYNTEEQRFVVRFFVGKKAQCVFVKKYFLFTLGNDYRIKRFATGSRNVTNISLMIKKLKLTCGSD
jgi:hypothetical protein